MSRYQRSMRSALQSVADSQIEFDEAVKWEVKITGLPTFYADGKSKGDVRRTLRKLLKRPDEIVSIERTTPAELKKIRRGQIQGDEPGDDEEVKEQNLMEDNRAAMVQNKELSIDDIVNMIQFGKPFEVVDEDIPAQLPPGDPNFPRYKDIPNSVVDKEDKKANKVKDKAEKDTLIPTKTQEGADTWHPDPEKDKKSTSYKHHVKITSGRPQAKRTDRFGHIKVTADQLRKAAKARQTEAVKAWTEDSEWAKSKEIERKDSERLARQQAERERRALTRAVEKSPKQQALARAQAKDKKNQNKDPVGKKHEAIDEQLPVGHRKPSPGADSTASYARLQDAKRKAKAAGKDYDRLPYGDQQKYHEAHPDAGVPLSVRRARKKKSSAQMRADMRHADQINKMGSGRRKERELQNVGVSPTPKWYHSEETEIITSRTVIGGQEFEVKEVSPPGWGHTKAEKEKTKPNKPKSKIGGSAHEFKKALDSGRFKGLPGDKTYKDKKASMFKLMWSMKNKGDKPHYKPGVKDKLKAKYKKDESVLDTAKRYLS